jgi:Ulp1 protease family, C-terminal catalytic domain
LQDRYSYGDNSSNNNSISTGTTNGVSTILLMDPIVVSYFMLQLDMGDMDDCITFWKSESCRDGFQAIRRVLLPINDTMAQVQVQVQVQAQNQPVNLGTHWSLLAIDIQKGTVETGTGTCSESVYKHHPTSNTNVDDVSWKLQGYHMDSVSHSGNIYCAKQVAKKLHLFIHTMQHYHATQLLLQASTPTHQGSTISSSTNTACTRSSATEETETTTTTTKGMLVGPDPTMQVDVKTVNVPQQTNGCDCGIHLLLNAETILAAAAVDQFQCFGTCTASSDGATTDSNDQTYFYQHQHARINNTLHFSKVERTLIARDIMEQVVSSAGGSK